MVTRAVFSAGEIDVLERIWPPGKELLTCLMTVCCQQGGTCRQGARQRLRGSVQSVPVRVTNRPGPRDVLHVLSAVQGNEQQPEGKSSKH